MSKRKNLLKSKITTCFLCGSKFKKLSEKHGHRINPVKGNSENNLVILCINCKKLFQKNKTIKIYNIELNKEIKNKYFSNIDVETKKIILNKIREFRKRNLNGFDEKDKDRI